jgi:sec-independent protein translocase protein TatC
MNEESKAIEKYEDTPKPLVTHLVELRRRLVWCSLALLAAFAVSYLFADNIYQFLVAPLAEASENGSEEKRRLIYTGLTEAFFTYMKVAFFAACFVCFPVFATQIYQFLSPGLYKNEKRVMVPYLIATPVLFFAGAAFAYYYVFPVGWNFFLSFENPDALLPIHLEARVSEYLSLVMQFIFAFGIAFQIPVVLTLLTRAGFTNAASLKKRRKYAIILIFIAAAVLTPPDVISQLSLAIPMMLLYEFSIICCRFIEGRAKDQECTT